MHSAAVVFKNLDIIEHIPFCLSTVSDLSSFHLVNRTCYEGSRNHLEYRTIRCALDREDFWTHLIEKPILARCVRSVKIIPPGPMLGQEDKEMLPPSISSTPPPRSPTPENYHEDDWDSILMESYLCRTRALEALLLNAIRLMDHLEHFDWDAYPPLIIPVSSKHDASEGVVEDVWTMLKQKTNLRMLGAVDLTCDSYVPEWRMRASPVMITSGLWEIEGLEEINLRLLWKNDDWASHIGRVVPGSPTPFETLDAESPYSRYKLLPGQLKRLLTHSPNLQSFKIYVQNAHHGYACIDITSVLESLYLPRLHTLDLWGLSADPNVFSAFLTRHASIEVLKVRFATDRVKRMDEVELAEGTLPALKRFRGREAMREAIERARGRPMLPASDETHSHMYNHDWTF